MKTHTRFTRETVRELQRRILLLEHVLRLTAGRRDRWRQVSVLKAGAL